MLIRNYLSRVIVGLIRKIKCRKHVAFLLSNGRDILGRAPVANAIIYNDRRQCCEAVTVLPVRRRLQ